MTQLLVVYFLRTGKIPFIQSSPSFPLLLSTLSFLGIAMAVPYIPGLNTAFGFAPLYSVRPRLPTERLLTDRRASTASLSRSWCATVSWCRRQRRSTSSSTPTGQSREPSRAILTVLLGFELPLRSSSPTLSDSSPSSTLPLFCDSTTLKSFLLSSTCRNSPLSLSLFPRLTLE